MGPPLRGAGTYLGASFGCLAPIGGFPTPHPYHLPVAVAFYALFTYGPFVYGSVRILVGRPRIGVGTLLLGGWVVATTRRLREAGFG